MASLTLSYRVADRILNYPASVDVYRGGDIELSLPNRSYDGDDENNIYLTAEAARTLARTLMAAADRADELI